MKIEEALKFCTDTNDIIIGNGVIEQVGSLFKRQFPLHRAKVIADRITYEIAGRKVVEILQSNGIEQDEPYIFEEQHLYAEWGYIDRLVEIFNLTQAIPIAVGSGTINDLCKLSSHLTGRRYMSVGTAASMDGDTSFGASITKDGVKQDFSCRAPQAWLGDTSIIGEAPRSMTASGYADLFAKTVAGADWILSDELGIESINPIAWSIIQDNLDNALAHPKEIFNKDPEAIKELVEGLIFSGLAMQAYQSSRPSSGADHQFSHLWNMEHHTYQGRVVSHGFQVSIGTLSSTAMYECALKEDFENLDVEACVDQWPSMEQMLSAAQELFRDSTSSSIEENRVKAKYITPEKLREELNRLKERWPIIKDRLKKQLIPFDEIKKRLQLAGAPNAPEQIGISREHLRDTYLKAQYIRPRYTILDLATRTGKMEQWLNELFGPGGRWYID